MQTFSKIPILLYNIKVSILIFARRSSDLGRVELRLPCSPWESANAFCIAGPVSCCHSLEQSYDSPHTKAFLLLQAHMWGLQLPIHDYGTDLKSVLDQSIRILQSRQTPITEYASSSIQAIHDGRRIFGYSATLS